VPGRGEWVPCEGFGVFAYIGQLLRITPTIRAHNIRLPAFLSLRTIFRVLLICMALGMGVPLAAVQTAPQRPRIGLVLGGGGAKGGAHIGVLKVLEELRVPIDFIVGTSVGAVMGGLYASGISPENLEAAVRSLNWQDLLTDRAPRRRLTFRRRQDDENIPSRFEVGFNHGDFQLPPGLITGQNVENTLRTLALPVARVHSFERLPIPFKAVATDIVTGEMVVLDTGDLATAIRASMSLPGAFAPVEVDGRLLVDGAVVRNLPVDVVREMGADVVIAVDLSATLRVRDQISTAIDVSSQVGTIATMANTRPQRESLVPGMDVLLVPPVGDVQVAEFRRLPETIVRGEQIARAMGGELRKYSVDEETYAGYRIRLSSFPLTGLRVDSIRIEGSSRLRDDVLRARLALPTGQVLTAPELSAALERLYGLGLFERVDHRIEAVDGHLILVVRLTEKAWGPGYARVGIAFGNDLQRGSSSFTLLTSHTQTAINRLGAEIRTELRIGEAQGVSAVFHQPLDQRGRYFSEAALFYREELLEVAMSGAGRASRGADEMGVSVSVGRFIGDWGELRVELSRGRVDLKGRGPQLTPREPDPAAAGILGRFTWDMLDDRAFPDRGVSGFVEAYRGAETLGSDPVYTRLEAKFFGVASRGDDALLFSAAGGTSFGAPLPQHHDFWLGGFGRLAGVKSRSVTGSHMLFGGVSYRRKLAVLPSGLAGGNLYGGLSVEAGNAWATRSEIAFSDLRASVGAYLGLETFLGPMYLSIAKGDRSDYGLFLFLGHAF
jgi:NTE family protein